MKMTKVDVVQKIKSTAQEYKVKLLGKTFLYIYENGSLEVSFRKAEFAHLTGAERKVSAESFFKLAMSGKLTANQIYFTSSHLELRTVLISPRMFTRFTQFWKRKIQKNDTM